MKKVRVLVVEDSLTIRKYLLEVLAGEDFEITAEAEDGKQAIELCQSLRPDVVTMDIMLPQMSGVAATEYIMAYCPTPIVIVSASVNRGEALKTYDALAAGALDVVEKPLATEDRDLWESRFRATVRMAARIKVITHPRGRLKNSMAQWSRDADDTGLLNTGKVRLIAIGASTGGPAAVAELLRTLPAEFPIPLLIVIHVAAKFDLALVHWLNTESNIPVSLAADMQRLPGVGTVGALLAPAGSHLVVQGGMLKLTHSAERHSCRPSVDVLFESIAAQSADAAACVLLTGMGRDGAVGMRAARQAGALTIAQDEASSVVFGMPGEAVKLNAAQRILPLAEIGKALMNLVRPDGALEKV